MSSPLDSDPLYRLAMRTLAAGERSKETADSRAPFAAYRDNPVGFFSEVLGVDPWGRHPGLPADQASQVDILEAVRDYDLVSVRSGHKVGKSDSAAGLAIWWTMTRSRARVILTAPTAAQVSGILWEEIRMLHSWQHPAQDGKDLPQLPGKCNLEPSTGLWLAPGWGIVGISTDTPERMAGRSGDRILYIVDEASGYDEALFAAILGNLAGGGKVAMFSNPTRTSGTFYDSHHEKRGLWHCLHVASTSTPNFYGGSIPGLAAPAWLRIAEDMWGGPGSAMFDIRVRGEFPAQGSMAIVSLALVEQAHARHATMEDTSDPLNIGLDIAREGDDESILAARRGKKCLGIEAVKIDRSPGALPPGPQVGEATVRMARRLRRPEDVYRPRVLLDSIGVGAAVLDYLVQNYSEELEIVAVNAGASAPDWIVVAPATETAPAQTAADVYRNMRAALWFGVALWLRDGAIPDDPRLDAELVAPTYSFIERGRLAVEEKVQIKKRLRRSPDRADALCLAVYDPPRAEVGGDGEDWNAKVVSDYRWSHDSRGW